MPFGSDSCRPAPSASPNCRHHSSSRSLLFGPAVSGTARCLCLLNESFRSRCRTPAHILQDCPLFTAQRNQGPAGGTSRFQHCDQAVGVGRSRIGRELTTSLVDSTELRPI
ncbi:hypothetical protein BaRGS_00019938 [Batillaria attramentaria]|uniref:Uncharacterized protein n=1 Tax=Batillaria attramentaria TaxID=370345 RepID=A0ABD0KPG5_9CAEN